jgi:hypothetical protein
VLIFPFIQPRNLYNFRSDHCNGHLRVFVFAYCMEDMETMIVVSFLCTFSDIVEAITPHKLLGLRQLLNSSAMDIMYYTSPLYGSEVRCESGLITDMCLSIF